VNRYLVAYAVSVAMTAALDVVWLGFIARDFVKSQLGPLLLEPPNFGFAAMFYVVYGVGVVIFAITPALAARAKSKAVLFGALFGFFNYATYDLTNLASLKGWPHTFAAFDIAWGTFATGLSALVAYLAAARMAK
jgi:uncharacterized membrane protein